jgi:hypothetical protein
MSHEQHSSEASSSHLPSVWWLLKPSMELEATARWFCCHQKINRHTIEWEKSDNESRSPEAGTPDLCHACPTAGSTETANEQPADSSPVPRHKESPHPCPGFEPRAAAGTDRLEQDCWRGEYTSLLERLNRKIANTFRDEYSAVIVVGWLRGFTSANERLTLRVEAIRSGTSAAKPEAYIVKIAIAPEVAERLEHELRGYRYLTGAQRGLGSTVFAALTEGFRSENKLQSLKYTDAEQTLRAGDAVITLERAVLDACTRGQPSVDSVEKTIVQLFMELDDTLYRHAWSEPEVDPDYLRRRLSPGLKNWLDAGAGKEAHRARHEILWALRDPDLQFVDPALYFNETKFPKMPEVLVGTSHGDLHGRNILVGIVEGEARWPVVFDYEDVKCCNLVGWDFVKLETELKKAALADPAIFPSENDADLIQKLYDFERRLSMQTKTRYDHNDWSREMDERQPALNSLMRILLTIRRMACKCLEVRRGRSRRWLHEYHFLLAAYGVYAARFQVYREVRPLKSLLVGAAVAAYRHAYGEDLTERSVALSKFRALERIASNQCHAPSTERNPPPTQAPHNDAATPEGQNATGAATPTGGGAGPWTPQTICVHKEELAAAKQLARSRQADYVQQAVGILLDLMAKHPFVIEPAYESAFAMLELAQLDADEGRQRDLWKQADRLLDQAMIRFHGQMHEELLSRKGRLKKDQADYWMKKDAGGKTATRLYKDAAEWYRKATEVTGGYYYPAVNEVTCLWLAGETAVARGKAERIIARLEELADPSDEQDLMWRKAAEGEAHVIACKDGWFEKAKGTYQDAMEIAKRDWELRHQTATMVAQLERILNRLGEPAWQHDERNRVERKRQLERLIEELREYR